MKAFHTGGFMTQAAPTTTTAPDAAVPAVMARHHFLLRRLHSLTGIVPVGLFVIMHLFTNFQLITGTFQHEVNFIHSLPALLFLEVTIWVSIGFHAALGVVYTFTGKPNTRHYRYMANWRYVLQRTTGLIALVFIFLHIATLRWHWTFGGLFETFYTATRDGYPLAAATTAKALQNNLVLAFYVVGVLSVIFHWCNGLWTAAISWGLTISTGAQRRWGYLCTALAVVLTLFMAGALVGARMYEVTAEDEAAIRQAQQEGPGHYGIIRDD